MITRWTQMNITAQLCKNPLLGFKIFQNGKFAGKIMPRKFWSTSSKKAQCRKNCEEGLLFLKNSSKFFQSESSKIWTTKKKGKIKLGTPKLFKLSFEKKNCVKIIGQELENLGKSSFRSICYINYFEYFFPNFDKLNELSECHARVREIMRYLLILKITFIFHMHQAIIVNRILKEVLRLKNPKTYKCKYALLRVPPI